MLAPLRSRCLGSGRRSPGAVGTRPEQATTPSSLFSSDTLGRGVLDRHDLVPASSTSTRLPHGVNKMAKDSDRGSMAAKFSPVQTGRCNVLRKTELLQRRKGLSEKIKTEARPRQSGNYDIYSVRFWSKRLESKDRQDARGRGGAFSSLRIQRVPRASPSPALPVLDSPPRKATAQEWTVPPCICDRENEGFAIPLDKRPAADGCRPQDLRCSIHSTRLSSICLPRTPVDDIVSLSGFNWNLAGNVASASTTNRRGPCQRPPSRVYPPASSVLAHVIAMFTTFVLASFSRGAGCSSISNPSLDASSPSTSASHAIYSTLSINPSIPATSRSSVSLDLSVPLFVSLRGTFFFSYRQKP